MLATFTAFVFAVSAGVVSSGLVGSLWKLVTGEAPSLASLGNLDLLTPLRGIVFVLSRPLILVVFGLSVFLFRPLAAISILTLGLGWSFLQGIVVLTQFIH